MKTIYVTLCTLLMLSTAAVPARGKGRQKTPALSLCDLAREPDRYDNQIVRLRAIYETGPETARLYDPACCCEQAAAWVEFEDKPLVGSQNILRKLQKSAKSNERVYVVFVGRFQGPYKYDTRDVKNPKLAEFLQKANTRYGHMNAYRFQFIPQILEAVEPVARGTPEFKWDTPEGPRIFPDLD